MIFVRNITFWPALAVMLLMVPGPAGFAYAQPARDTAITAKPDDQKHSTLKATILAACLPGAGQAYNRKYWKIPIAYVGYSAAGAALWTYQRNYRSAKNDYIALTDTLESTVNQSGKTKQELRADIDTYRRFRDLSVLGLLAWHGLTIIDANVDAHFFSWDISEDLSLNIRPRALWADRIHPGVGLSMTFNCK